MTASAEVRDFLMTGRTRRRALGAAGLVLAVSTAVLAVLTGVSATSQGQTIVILGILSSTEVSELSIIAALTSLAVGLCLVAVPRVWLLLLVPARTVAILSVVVAAGIGAISPAPVVTALLSDSCETGYVVLERSFLLLGGGSVYRLNGILATRVAFTAGDDGYQPFADGNYTVAADDATLRIWYNAHFDGEPAPPAATGRADVTLPIVTEGTNTCGRAKPVPAWATRIAGESAASSEDTDRPGVPPAGISEMAELSLASAVEPVRTADGEAVDPAALPRASTPCGEDGSASSLSLAFQTGDNAASLERILSAWDAAGYLPDRAMQQDIRHSSTLPVEKMTIRDSTTIDGLIHMEIIGQCAVASG